MKSSTFIVHLFVVYSARNETQFQRLVKIISSFRRLMMDENVSLVLNGSVQVEQSGELETKKRTGFQIRKADIVLMLIGDEFLPASTAHLPEIFDGNKAEDVLIGAITLSDLDFTKSNLYQKVVQNFTVFLLDKLPEQVLPLQYNNLFEKSFLKLIRLAIRNQSGKLFQNMLKEANQKFKNGKWEMAGQLYSQMLKTLPDSVSDDRFNEINDKLLICFRELHFEQLVKNGERAFQQKDYPVAANFFEKALQIKPAPKVVLLREKSLVTPVPAYKILKQQNEEDWFFESLQEAEKLFKLKKWNAALEQYEEAAAVFHIDFGYNISNIYRQMKACKTECCFEEVFNLGREAYKAKNHHEAMSFFEEAYSIKPEDSTAKRLYEKSKRIVHLKKLLPVAQILSISLLALLLIYMLVFFTNSI